MQKYIGAILVKYSLYATIIINNYYILFYKNISVKYWFYYNCCNFIIYKLIISPLF